MFILLPLFMLIFLCGCEGREPVSGQPAVSEFRCDLMGTEVAIKIRTTPDHHEKSRLALEAIYRDMQAMVAIISSWEPASQVSRINEKAGVEPVAVNREVMHILKRASEVSERSGGAFDITFSAVGTLYQLRPVLPVIPSQGEIDDALKLVGYQKLILDQTAGTAYLTQKGMRIDLGGIAKGSVIDLVDRRLQEEGYDNYLINAGGDLLVHAPAGAAPWSIAITDPRNPEGSDLGEIVLSHGAIVTSGDYERAVLIQGKRYHHIIDPRTGWPVDKTISVTVTGPDAESADAWATAFFVMGPEAGLTLCEQLDGIEAFFIDAETKTHRSSGFPVMKNEKTNTEDASVKRSVNR